eukprot:UN07853
MSFDMQSDYYNADSNNTSFIHSVQMSQTDSENNPLLGTSEPVQSRLDVPLDGQDSSNLITPVKMKPTILQRPLFAQETCST